MPNPFPPTLGNRQAATAWRLLVGDTALDARPERVETADRLLCLTGRRTGGTPQQ